MSRIGFTRQLDIVEVDERDDGRLIETAPPRAVRPASDLELLPEGTTYANAVRTRLWRNGVPLTETL